LSSILQIAFNLLIFFSGASVESGSASVVSGARHPKLIRERWIFFSGARRYVRAWSFFSERGFRCAPSERAWSPRASSTGPCVMAHAWSPRRALWPTCGVRGRVRAARPEYFYIFTYNFPLINSSYNYLTRRRNLSFSLALSSNFFSFIHLSG
jgi:hypothetical protein